MLGGNKRKMKNQGGNQRNMNQQNRAGGNNNNRANNNFNNTNFNNSQQQQLPQMGYVDFSSNFNDQQVGRQNNNQNNGKPFRKNNLKGGNNQGRMQNNNNNKNNNVRNNQNANGNGGNGNGATGNNFQTANGGNNPHNWNMRRAQTNDTSNSNMMQQNQQQPFNPPPPLMNQRMPNFNRNMRGGNRGQFIGGGGPPMRRNFPMPPIPNGNFMPNGGGNGPMPPMQFNRQMMRPRFPNRNNNTAATNNKTRKNPNLSKVDKPKNRKQQNLNKKNANAAAAAAGGTTAAATTTTAGGAAATGATKNRNKVKRQQNREQYPMTAAFVTDEIREEFEKKEKVLAELTGKGKNDELFAKFKEQRDIFVKMYDVAKAAHLVRVAAEKALRKVSNSKN